MGEQKGRIRNFHGNILYADFPGNISQYTKGMDSFGLKIDPKTITSLISSAGFDFLETDLLEL